MTDSELMVFVRERWSQKETIARMAIEADVHENTIRRIAKELQLPAREGFGMSQETRDRLRGLWRDGVSAREIGLALDMTKNMVVGHARRMQLPPRESPIKRNAEGTPRSKAEGKPIRERAKPAGKGAPAAEIPIAKAPPRTCQWLRGEPRLLDFCGEKAVPGRPYCAAHVAKAYIPRDKTGSTLAAE